MKISEYTVKNHAQHIFGKLKVNSRAEAVAKFIARGGNTRKPTLSMSRSDYMRITRKAVNY
jgi:hypothetical protein